jgi:hypothetical protein
MSKTRRTIVRETRSPVELLHVALDANERICDATKRQSRKNDRYRQKPEIQLDPFEAFVSRFLCAAQEAERERIWHKTLTELMKCVPDSNALEEQLNAHLERQILPKISKRLHRFIRLWEHGAVIITRGY